MGFLLAPFVPPAAKQTKYCTKLNVTSGACTLMCSRSWWALCSALTLVPEEAFECHSQHPHIMWTFPRNPIRRRCCDTRASGRVAKRIYTYFFNHKSWWKRSLHSNIITIHKNAKSFMWLLTYCAPHPARHNFWRRVNVLPPKSKYRVSQPKPRLMIQPFRHQQFKPLSYFFNVSHNVVNDVFVLWFLDGCCFGAHSV